MKFKKLIISTKGGLTDYLLLIVYLPLSLFAVLPFFKNGFFAFHDDVQVARVYEMGGSLASGQFPVRWVADLGYGLGYPLFNFYSVFPYYIGGFLNVLGLDALVATKIVFIIGILLSGVSMFFLTKDYFGKVGALVASIVYLYFPYHAVNIYVRGALAEVYGYAFLPIVFFSIFRIHSQERFSKLYIVLGSLSIAAVVLSHNLSAFMLFIFVGLFILWSIAVNKNRKQIIFSYGLVLFLGFLLSAFYALPAAFESKYTNIGIILGGASNPLDHFVCLGQLWDSPWGFAGSASGCVDGMSFKLGKLNIILTFVALILAAISFRKLKDNKFVVGASILFLFVSIFMVLPISSFLWNLPFMEYLQFPWRFLNFVGLFMSLLIAYLVWQVEQIKNKLGTILAILIIGITLFTTFKLFTPQEYLNRDVTYYTNLRYLNWTASKISDEYLPKDSIRPGTEGEEPQFLNYGGIFLRSHGSPFIVTQTPLETTSNILSLIGVIALVLVIINRPNLNHGKKTS